MFTYAKGYEDELYEYAAALDISLPHGSRVLITGATGLLGSHLVDLLMAYSKLRDLDIIVLACGRSLDSLHARFRDSPFGIPGYFVWDLANPVAQFDGKVDFVIHAASKADPKAKGESPVETFLDNFSGTVSLLNLIMKQKSGRMLYVSSGEFYGQFPNDGAGATEGYCGYLDYSNPSSCYASSKRASEMLCLSYGQEYGVDSIIVRPCHLFGPTARSGDTRALSSFFRDAASGASIRMNSEGGMVRSHCYAGDAAAAILMLLDRGRAGEVYNISDPYSVCSIREFAEEVASSAETNVFISGNSRNQNWKYQQSSHAILNSNKLQGLGWKPLHSKSENIHRTICFLQDSLKSDR